jgi:hypothetical protein
LKKQTQFSDGQKKRKCVYERKLCEIMTIFRDEKTNPIKANYRDLTCKIQELFRGLGCRKGYTIAYVKLEFYEFWEVNHEKQ